MSTPVRPHARNLASILLEAKVVNPEQVDAALVRQRSTGLRIGETLVEMGAATEQDIGWALARQLNVTFVDLRPEALDAELIRSFPEGLLHRLDAVPLVGDEEELSVALADPTDSGLVDELQRAAGRPLKLAVATTSAIRRVLQHVLGAAHVLRSPLGAPAPEGQFDVRWERTGAGFLTFHLRQAALAGASEIHFLSRRDALEVQHRVGDRLVRLGSEPPGALHYLLSRLEALGGPVLDDRRVHSARRVACPADAGSVELGISILRQEEGVSVSLEIRPATARRFALDEIGLDPVDLARLRGALDARAGLGIVTGPPRAGGSTTLACLLAEAGITDRRCLAFGVGAGRVPTEAIVAGTAAGAAEVWAEAAVAQCADVVVLDGVLAGTAVTAALSPAAAGRLLLVRTDSTDTFAMLEQLAARAPDRAAVAERLRFVIQQRLVRVDGGAGPAGEPDPRRARRAVFEVLIVEAPLREALRAGQTAERLRACAVADGLQPLADRLEALVASGDLSATEAARVRA